MPQDKLPEPGEFTRIFKRQHMSGHGGAGNENLGDVSASGVHAEPPAAPPPPPPLSEPAPAHKAETAAKTEPGEFTQYFMGGVGRGATKPPAPSPTRGGHSGVQRPNSAYVFRSADGTGSFTERFGSTLPSRSSEPPSTPPYRPGTDPASSEAHPSGAFDLRPGVPAPLPSKQDSLGEYTSLFGKGNTPPPPRQNAVAQPPSAPLMSDAPFSVPPPALPGRFAADLPGVNPVATGPSEHTIISKGRAGAAGGNTGAPLAEAAAAGAGASASRRSPVNLNVNPINPLQSLGGGSMNLPGASANMSMSGAGMNTPLGSVNMQVPSAPQANLSGAGGGTAGLSPQTKLILFFALLAILAVVLVVVVAATQKN